MGVVREKNKQTKKTDQTQDVSGARLSEQGSGSICMAHNNQESQCAAISWP